MDAANVRREFRRALHLVPGLEPTEWTPREMRRSFVSVLSDAGVPLEEISRLVGHSFRARESRMRLRGAFGHAQGRPASSTRGLHRAGRPAPPG